ncbi:hypothetical protein [Flavobacterium olei]|uniref:hypothetical protein n=1 Tax=Flavobacterium olei TaxID=1886782 RepID=UPI00321BD34A
MIYENINRDSRGQNITGKIITISNKEELFNKAMIFPVYKADLDKEKKIKLLKNEDCYLVYYIGRIYVFTYNNSVRLFENDPLIQQIEKSVKEKKKISIVYFTDSFYSNNFVLKTLISDQNLSFILDREQRYTDVLQFINLRYGSFEKYQEILEIEKQRKKITGKDAINVIKHNYANYQYNCPKDTSLVIKKMAEWVNLASGGITKEQESNLIRRIKNKIDPLTYLEGVMSKATDNKYRISANERIEYNEAEKKVIKFTGAYDYLIYGANITNELIDVLTVKQFENYKNYVDIYFPAENQDAKNIFKTFRSNYSIAVLRKDGFLKTDSYGDYENFANKILSECGCPFDSTVKRELIIR